MNATCIRHSQSAFLNAFINEEVFGKQPLDFEDKKHQNHVLKLSKALYGLKRVPRAWYKRLSIFLIENKFDRGKVDNTFFIKHYDYHFLLVQIYVDDIIFGSSNKSLCEDFDKLMTNEFDMSTMGELSFSLVLQVKQIEIGIFISQEKIYKRITQEVWFEHDKTHGYTYSSFM